MKFMIVFASGKGEKMNGTQNGGRDKVFFNCLQCLFNKIISNFQFLMMAHMYLLLSFVLFCI